MLILSLNYSQPFFFSSIKRVLHKPYTIIKMEEGSGNSNSNEVKMGGCNDSNVSGVVGGSSRWNPTKEQISMLENLYKQGIKTPSAEEIQQITARLRVYGHIEGKNVFYWFQNHKARQRQKQKQETIAYFNRFLNHTTPNPFFSPPICTNALCAPYCITQTQSHEIGFHPPHPKVLVPVGFRRNPSEKVVGTGSDMSNINICNGPVVYEGMQKQQQRILDCNKLSHSNQETLDLFPLHPTGILEEKTTDQVSSLPSLSADSSTDDTPDDDINQQHDHHDAYSLNQPFFDFFTTSGQAS